MANFSVWLGGIFLIAFAIFGAVQSTLDVQTSTGTGFVVASQAPVCLDRCMQSCITNAEDEGPCTQICERECS